MEVAMQGKWITHLKTLGLVFLVGFGINLLFVGAVALGDYDRQLGQNFHRAVLIMVAYLIVRLWQQRDQTVPFFGEPRWQWLEGKPERKLVMLLLVALIAMSGLATYLGLHQQQRLLTDAEVGLRWDDLSPVPPWALTDHDLAVVSSCKGKGRLSTLEEFNASGQMHCWM
jgi:hypothetical protein